MINLDDLPYKHILDKLYDGVYVVDRERRIIYWNDGAERLSGYSSEDMVDSHCWDNKLLHVDGKGVNLCHGYCPLMKTIDDGQDREEEVFLHHRDGHRVPVSIRVVPLYDSGNEIIGAVEIFSDNMVDMNVMAQIEELQRLAMLDPLTELGNRRYAQQQLDAVFGMYGRQKTPFGVLFIDIDYFKQINDQHGHDAGDRILKMTAKTLSRNVRSFDVVGRWGGEEFICIIKNVDENQLGTVAEKLRMLVAESSISLGEKPLAVTISVGGAIVREDDSPTSIIDRADQQMYHAKNTGRNRVFIG